MLLDNGDDDDYNDRDGDGEERKGGEAGARGETKWKIWECGKQAADRQTRLLAV